MRFRWYQRAADCSRDSDAERAYAMIVNVVLRALAEQQIPFEFVYDPVGDTTNIVLPANLADKVHAIFVDARFIERTIPQKDVRASAELFEAIKSGSNMNKTWQ